MVKLLWIMLGGAIGALFRYLASGIAYRYIGGDFPWGTLGVNIVGAFIIGFLWGISERTMVSPNTRLFVFVGIIGSFTTFSTFCLETFNLLRDGEIKLALANVFITNTLGIVLVILGLLVARYMMFVIERR